MEQIILILCGKYIIQCCTLYHNLNNVIRFIGCFRIAVFLALHWLDPRLCTYMNNPQLCACVKLDILHSRGERNGFWKFYVLKICENWPHEYKHVLWNNFNIHCFISIWRNHFVTVACIPKMNFSANYESLSMVITIPTWVMFLDYQQMHNTFCVLVVTFCM